MKNAYSNFLLLLFISISINISAQNYFQQKVNYDIHAKLDDTQHLLDCQMRINYQNNAPHELNEIYIHLWANAYSSKSSPFAEQLLRMKRTNFHYAEPNEMGGYKEIQFDIGDSRANWSYMDSSKEIVKISLDNPLENGEWVNIDISFNLKIPKSFSRLGHIKTSYQMTQWYPKPAVFDQSGWHTMPYLSLGEFYSEFGDFKVTLELPSNYVVAATGTLETESEIAFLNKKVAITDRFIEKMTDDLIKNNNYPISSDFFKTISFSAKNVHDFAWFADKRFFVQKSKVNLSLNNSVDTWAFFTNDEIHLWKDATSYINDALVHYSKNIGNYPYPQATAVQSALSAGAGMEYPMITVIGLSKKAKSLDNVITHEVGHNWFYGILANNERDYAWIDEGLNTYMETRYMDEKYGDASHMIPQFIANMTDMNERDLFYLLKAAINNDQSPSSNSNELSMFNYMISAYSKPGKVFQYLEKYVGTDRFDQAMHNYYEQWKFKHPTPADIQKSFEQSLGENLDWVFKDFLSTTKKMDYAIRKLKLNNGIDIEIENRGKIVSPVLINGLKDGEVMFSEWSEGFEDRKTIHIESENLDEIVLDEFHYTLDINRENNQAKVSGLFKKTNPLKIGLGFGLNHSKQANYYVIPSLGYNTHDGFMLGLGLHNLKLPTTNLEFYLMPMYGFHARSLAGIGEVRYSWYPDNVFDRIQLGIHGKRFNYLTNKQENEEYDYTRLNSFIDFEFGRSFVNSKVQNIKLSWLHVNVESAVYQNGDYLGSKQSMHPYYKLDYTFKDGRTINPYNASINVEYNDFEQAGTEQQIKYIKLGAGLNGTINYTKKKSIDYRFFVGTFLQNDRRSYANDPSGQLGRGEFGLSYQSYHDNYLFNDYFFGRNESSGLWSRQILIKEGGFKNALTNTYSNQFGQSNDYMTAVNLAIDIPKIPLLQLYVDMGYYGESINQSIEPRFLYSSGIVIKIPYLMHIYFPILNSKVIKDAYSFAGKSTWHKQITFSLNLKNFNMDKVARSFLYY